MYQKLIAIKRGTVFLPNRRGSLIVGPRNSDQVRSARIVHLMGLSVFGRRHRYY